MQNHCRENDNDVVYKDVVIIGNGPSGICLSYMLAGNWPYYTGEPHPGDEMLTARLHLNARSGSGDRCEAIEQKVENGTNDRWQENENGERRGLVGSTRCKLECLSSGLEGRQGGRPLALLMDQLQHPSVDAGFDVPSLLTWKSIEEHPEHKAIDHVVLGKGQPGGSWQSMDPNVLTISLNRWMSLPDLDIREWEMSEQLRKINSTTDSDSYRAFQEIPTAHKTASRISIGTVAAYYRDYVRIKRLEQYFRCGTVVTSVRPVCASDSQEEEEEEEDHRYGWIVDGYEKQIGKPFRYRCRRVVLATGATDSSNRLNIPGENSYSDWVMHDVNELESKLDRLIAQQQHENEIGERRTIDPALVVGAGLSAADAIMAARFRGIPVLHAFRDFSTEWHKPEAKKRHSIYERLQGLPSSMYPEYHKVYEMMADGGTNYPLYKALPGYNLLGFAENRSDLIDTGVPRKQQTVTLSDSDGCEHVFPVSVVAVLIGYKPDLSYLENDGLGLGKYPDKPIDSKLNPIQVDDFTYEVTAASKPGLYALGPLVGDNFVRYILGGAFGILVNVLNTLPPT